MTREGLFQMASLADENGEIIGVFRPRLAGIVMRFRLAVVACMTMFASSSAALAQSAEDAARIDFEAAKMAVADGDCELGLDKIDRVVEVLGEQPELMILAARCSMNLRYLEDAEAYVKKVFDQADDTFRASEEYASLIQLGAELEILKKGGTAKGKRWRASGVCQTQYYPYTKTYMRKWLVSVDGRKFTRKETVKEIASHGVIVVHTSDDGESTEMDINCPDKGDPFPKCERYFGPRTVKAGRFDAIRIECDSVQVVYVPGVGTIYSYDRRFGDTRIEELVEWSE